MVNSFPLSPMTFLSEFLTLKSYFELVTAITPLTMQYYWNHHDCPQNKVWIPHFAPNIPLSLSFWSSDFPLWHPSKIVILGHWFWLNLIGYTFQHNQFFIDSPAPKESFCPVGQILNWGSESWGNYGVFMRFEGLKKIQENLLYSTEKCIHIANAKWHITFNIRFELRWPSLVPSLEKSIGISQSTLGCFVKNKFNFKVDRAKK